MPQIRTLLGCDLKELEAIAEGVGAPRYAGGQLAQWLYVKRVTSFEAMTNLSLAVRKKLAELYTVGREAPSIVRTSRDGTKKYLFLVGEDRSVETAMIPDRGRVTLCVSTQAGCRMGCKFCATGQQAFKGSLTVGEILNQLMSVEESEELTNVVLMGMGEPLDNMDAVLSALRVMTSSWGMAWSPRRITLSTVGLRNGLERFLSESECHLAVSLHSPFDRERGELLPATRSFPLKDLMRLLQRYDWRGQRRLSFEYVVLCGVNDTPQHMEAVAQLLRGVPCLVNLITYHAHGNALFAAPSRREVEMLRDMLNRRGVRATVRASRGVDIEAGCGMLSRNAGVTLVQHNESNDVKGKKYSLENEL